LDFQVVEGDIFAFIGATLDANLHSVNANIIHEIHEIRGSLSAALILHSAGL
jgi:hypothetical protein